MGIPTLLGLFLVTGGATVLGSLPVCFHRYLKESQWTWWESFGAGVMVSASIFSLFLPAITMAQESGESYLLLGISFLAGVLFIFLMGLLIRTITENVLHQRAYLFVFVMGLHNIPEGLAVGVDVAALGWRESLPLAISIFIQNLPEGLVSSMSFLISGFALKKALLANFVTAVIETVSSFTGFSFTSHTQLGLPQLLTFAGASMMSVVLREVLMKRRSSEAATFSVSGFGFGLAVCAALDLLL
jgi:ZIP family zinc transporter